MVIIRTSRHTGLFG